MSWQYGGEVAEAPDRQELLTALTTEHFTLQAARSQTASESAALYVLSVSQRSGGAGVHRPGVADRHHLRCLRPDRTPDALYEEPAVAFADESAE